MIFPLRIRSVVVIAVSFFLCPLAQTGCAPRAVEFQGAMAQAIRDGIKLGKQRFDHSQFDALLRKYVRLESRQVNYSGFKQQRDDFDRYLRLLSRVDLRRLSRDELLALFINAYNAYMIDAILRSMTDQRPEGVASVRDIAGAFNAERHLLAGIRVSLDNIEHNIIRPFFKDPRIHFAVNCASIGCPALANEAYTGDRIDDQLDAATRRTLQSPHYVRIDGSALRITKIMSWYQSDFVNPEFRGSQTSLARYIRTYANDEVKAFLDGAGDEVSISFLPYDWSLNGIR